MVKSPQGITPLMLFLLFIVLGTSFDLKSMSRKAQPVRVDSSQENVEDCQSAQAYEYIDNFKLPLKDVSKLLSEQFSHNEIQNFVFDKNKVENIKAQSRLISADQSESYASFAKATVFNNQTQFTITCEVNITERFFAKDHVYKVTTKISNIGISYDKELNLNTGVFVINSVNVNVTPSMMSVTYQPTPQTDHDKNALNTIIQGNSTSLYTQFVSFFNKNIIKTSMETNSKNQHLSYIYQQNPYIYNLNTQKINFSIPIDVSTVRFNVTPEGKLTHGMTAKLPGNNKYCSDFVPNFTNTGSSLFFTKEFIQNFVEYNLVAFKGWKNITVDKKTIRSDLLQWELLDLEYIVDGLWNDLTAFFQNQIFFTCSAKENVGSILQNGNKLNQHIRWFCEGFVKLNETSQQKIMEFMPRINHIVDLGVYQNKLRAYVNVLQFVECQFNEVRSLDGKGVYKVNEKSSRLTQKFIQSVFNDFRTYPIGERFWLGPKSSSLLVEKGMNGVWVL